MFNFFNKIDNSKRLESLQISKDELEIKLLDIDMDYDMVEDFLKLLPDKIKYKKLKTVFIQTFSKNYDTKIDKETPFVELVVGINGAGKTTTIAKLANLYKQNNQSLILGAGDTFRAAAIKQLKSWATKLNVDIVATKQGHDPSSVAFDTIQKAISKKIDNVIIDTAGRLHTDNNLGRELQKIVRICDKSKSGAPHRKLIVLDGTQSGSAFSQVKAFDDMIKLDGIIVSKLDGTAGGGVIFSILEHLDIPIVYIGVGEKVEDFKPFELELFIDMILDKIFNNIKEASKS